MQRLRHSSTRIRDFASIFPEKGALFLLQEIDTDHSEVKDWSHIPASLGFRYASVTRKEEGSGYLQRLRYKAYEVNGKNDRAVLTDLISSIEAISPMALHAHRRSQSSAFFTL